MAPFVVDADFTLNLSGVEGVPNYGRDEGDSDRDADCGTGHEVRPVSWSSTRSERMRSASNRWGVGSSFFSSSSSEEGSLVPEGVALSSTLFDS